MRQEAFCVPTLSPYFFLAIPTCWSKTRATARGTQRRGRNILKGKESDWQQLGNWSQLKKKAKNCHAQKWTNTCLPRNIFSNHSKAGTLNLAVGWELKFVVCALLYIESSRSDMGNHHRPDPTDETCTCLVLAVPPQREPPFNWPSLKIDKHRVWTSNDLCS